MGLLSTFENIRLALQYQWQYKLGLTDKNAIRDVNNDLLSLSMPVINHGVLYVEPVGIASADIARRAAQLAAEGDYTTIVISGGKTRDQDIFAKKTGIDPADLGWEEGETEAQYAYRVFNEHLRGELGCHKPVSVVLREGFNTGEKYRISKQYLDLGSDFIN